MNGSSTISLANDSSLYYNDKLKLSYTADTNKYHVKEGPTLLVGSSPVTLSGSDGVKTCTLGDYAHNTVVNASIVYAVNEYPLTITSGNGGSMSVNGQTASTKRHMVKSTR